MLAIAYKLQKFFKKKILNIIIISRFMLDISSIIGPLPEWEPFD